MKELTKDTILYHGNYTIVENIDLNQSEDNKDFGRGFYVTTPKEQAISFIKLSINKAKIKNRISADNTAIKILLPQELDNQVCFKTNEAIECLEYIGNEKHECK